MKRNYSFSLRVAEMGIALFMAATAAGIAGAADTSFIGPFNTITTVSTTVPKNGDVNPYGIARVPRSTGSLVEGQYLISNFNNGGNLQGTGTTIVQIAPNGAFSLFATIDAGKVACPGGIGLTTALVALQSGLVIVGSLPTTDGTAATAEAGCLIVLDSKGNVIETFSGHNINGPWDMTAVDDGNFVVLFVTNVLNGTVAANGSVVNRGTVVRLLISAWAGKPPQLLDSDVVGSGFPERTDPTALVIGPTGLAFDRHTGILYVADSLDNRIAAIPGALHINYPVNLGITVSRGGKLNDPLGLALAPNHNLLVANGDDGYIVEVNPFTYKQVAAKLADDTGGPPPGAGALFGLIAAEDGVYFVDDASNTLDLLH
jgi:DNA-binding beta-propeller fold protein YncE